MEHLLTPHEAADMLGISVSTLYTWTYRRRIPFQKVGRCLRFSPDALSGWLAQHARPALAPWQNDSPAPEGEAHPATHSGKSMPTFGER